MPVLVAQLDTPHRNPMHGWGNSLKVQQERSELSPGPSGSSVRQRLVGGLITSDRCSSPPRSLHRWPGSLRQGRSKAGFIRNSCGEGTSKTTEASIDG
jgi:hypothetical protein